MKSIKPSFFFPFSTNEIAISEETHANDDGISGLYGGVGGDVFQQFTAAKLTNADVMAIGAIGKPAGQRNGFSAVKPGSQA